MSGVSAVWCVNFVRTGLEGGHRNGLSKEGSMTRLPPIGPEELTDKQRLLFEAMSVGVSAKYDAFITTRADGALLGPWNAWLHDPELGEAFWTVTQAMTKARRIPEAPRQVAILVTGAHFGAAYEIYAHGAVASARLAMSERRIATLAAGERPEDLDAGEAVAHDVAKALLRGGVLADPLYALAMKRFGQEGVNELIYLVGHYCFVSMTLNGFAIPVPTQAPTRSR
ncbi:carboxymuconolactone decarboxylase family protein [Sphingomonas sp. BIUV-7]|uniref:Carboxymuconolactone decarboxylase family protein n=1 Tax=Sphingomonas natans TaxID=3063330 RepID=A0ABT8Y7B3_9SPHN|nr:carboxymuconolactone decarboxylase family protein [Sphingomonas sp. BIUV-7]MDO6414211.1 carboxymuconolactone decarboxylase family protein [Sphingomonas sp. BIUV-7]